MNLQPGPSQSIVELPRLTRSLHRTTIPASPLLRYPSLRSIPSFLTISAFLAESFRIMELLPEGRIVPLNARPCIFIFRCRMMEKKNNNNRRTFDLRVFHFSLQSTFLLKSFSISRISSNITDISRDLL